MFRTFLSARWENLIMANYEVDPEILLPYLPKGVELDFFEGKTYVSLVGFMFTKTRIFGIPVPFLGNFEEVNLRFYVLRKDGDQLKRGVVFVNETVPYKLVAWMADKLYKEHYTAIPTTHEIHTENQHLKTSFAWQINNAWNQLHVTTPLTGEHMKTGSLEEFIFEHYYGYTRVSSEQTLEYRVNHPTWKTRTVQDASISCDFEAMYGSTFAHLSKSHPSSIFFAEGSDVSVDWKRNSIN